LFQKKNEGTLLVSLKTISKSEIIKEFWSDTLNSFDLDHNGSISSIELNGLLAAIGSKVENGDAIVSDLNIFCIEKTLLPSSLIN
jgi:hypothetical protein